jgi:DNA adenine methylase
MQQLREKENQNFLFTSYLNKEVTIKATPFLKWVGGKRSIIGELKKRLPTSFGEYYEGFVGGGALFFEIQQTNSHLSDANFDLILTYKAIQNDPEKLISLLERHQKNHCEEYYYKTRSLHNLEDPIARAARMIYLNKTCFNGLWRVNSKGEFNVPMGSYINPAICNEENIMACNRLLAGIDIRFEDYLKIEPKPGDFVYFDPPYHPISQTSFTAYSKPDFTEKNQTELSEFCSRLTPKGVYVMISNSNTKFIRELYKKSYFKIETVSAPRAVNCKGNGRSAVEEVLITNY